VAVYYVYSGAAGSNNGSTWANAFTTLTTAFATEVAGDTLYVAHDHAESTAAAVTLTSSGTYATPTKVVCVNRAGSVPPVSADRRATATVTTTGNNALTLANPAGAGAVHYDGIIFTAGNSTGTANVALTTGSSNYRLDNCSLRLGGTGTSSKILLGASGNYIELNNTTMSFGNVNQTINPGAVVRWRNTASALLGTLPTQLFIPAAFNGGDIELVGVDLSAATSGKTLVQGSGTNICALFRFIDCKLNASVTKSQVPADGAVLVDFIRSGSSGINYTIYRHRTQGLLIEETTIVRTGGATDGTTPLSWKVVTTANCNYSMPYECPPIAIWNDTTGSAVTATVEGIWGGGAVPLDSEIWVDVEYLGDAASPQGSFVNDGAADLLATGASQTSSSATWGGSTTKFKLNVTFTAQQKGWIYARVKCAKASSTFYIDPLITLT
jgi:hypothetical protein